MRNTYTNYNLNERIGNNDSFRIAQFIARETIRRISGEGQDEILGNKPSARFFSGTLFGLVDTAEGEDISEESEDNENDEIEESEAIAENGSADDSDPGTLLMGSRRVNPQSCGLRFILTNVSGTIRLFVKFDLWGRVLPHYFQCIKNPNRDRTDVRPEDIEQRWVQVGTVRVNNEIDLDSLEEGVTELNQRIAEEINRITQDFLHRTDIFRLPNVRQDIPSDETAFNQWLNSYEGTIFNPTWNVVVETSLANIPMEGGLNYRFDIRIVNNSRCRIADRSLFENSIFCSKIEVNTVENHNFIRHLPADIRLLDPRQEYTGILADGLACVSEEQPDENGNPSNIIETVATPVFSQPLLTHTNFPETDIGRLRENPFGAASAFLERMEAFDNNEWEQEIQRERNLGRPEHILRATNDRRLFQEEITNVRTTKNLLSPTVANHDVQQAFNLMIETITRMNNARIRNGSRRPLNPLRPFQLGFILATIPDIVERKIRVDQHQNDYVSRADLIWFPTGGGKTEAFQALALFTAFYDRIKGKESGVSAWMLFALRALTVQQTQRLFEIVYHAENVRSERKIRGSSFKIGFLVGGQYSPTEITTYEDSERSERKIIEKIASDNRTFVYTPHCPECGNDSVRSRWNRDTWTLEFFCSNQTCSIHDITLPVSVIDDEIRRFPTSFIVGTIDKITGAGLTDKFHSLLRTPSFSCPIHGYSQKDRNNKCNYYYPDKCNQNVQTIEPMDTGPSLIIIDEVHLLEEELGAFASHYFSLLWEIQKSAGFPIPKVVLSSATMTEAATAEGQADTVPFSSTQVWNLTGLTPRRFPSPPPTRNNSFYYTRNENETQRFFIGIHPHGKTENDTVILTLKAIHSILQDLYNQKLADLLNRNLGDDEKKRLLLPYWTSIDYVLALKQADGLRNSIDIQLNNTYMRDENRAPVNASDVISSRLRPYELAQILRLLESTDPSDFEARYNTIPASSSIAYGVDIQNINLMILIGQPRRVSEDIQVTSRTARSQHNTGLVFRLYHPVRQRDMTHYLLFHNYHLNQDLLVEDIAINRFFTRSIRRTMPGIFMALLYNTQQHRNGIINMRKQPLECKRFLENDVNLESLRSSINNIFIVNFPGNGNFDAQVGIVFEANKDAILNNYNPNPGKWGTSMLLPEQPMTSLRDIDPQIEIAPVTNDVYLGALLDAGLTRRTMRRSRIQVILSHIPGATFEYQGGETIVRSSRIEPDISGLQVDRLVLAQNLSSLIAGSTWSQRFFRGGNFLNNLSNQIVPVRPGRVLVNIFPLTLTCTNRNCQHVWQFDPATSDLTCPRCRTGKGKQIRHVAIHECGNIQSLYVPSCSVHNRAYIKLFSAPQEVSRWRWICDEAGHNHPLSFLPNHQRCRNCGGGHTHA